MRNPLISVVIPTFNRAKLLKRAINSVQNQTFSNWEIVIVDNFSNDETDLILEPLLSDKILIIKINNEGLIAKSRNIGIQNAKGKYIAFLDSDDWWLPKKLELIINEFTKYKDTELIYHNCYLIKKDNSKLSKCRRLKNNQYEDLMINGNTIITSSVTVRKDCLKKVNYFSENKNKIGWEDYDLWLKIAKCNLRIHLYNKYLGNYHIGDDNYDNPKQIIKNLENIKKIIINPFIENNKNIYVWWINYTSGIAYYNLGNRKKSKFFFKKVFTNKSPKITKLKSLFYLIIKTNLN